MEKTMTIEEALKRYVTQTNMIRDLQSLSVTGISSANKYQEQLQQNYLRIGELADDNVKILKKYLFPIFYSNEQLGEKEIDQLRRFSEALIDAYNLNNLDAAIVYHHAERLYRETKEKGDRKSRIIALDGMVSASYLMICMTARLLPDSDICYQYYNKGIAAGEELLTYLDREEFLALSDEEKELVVINARYIRVVSEIDDVPGTHAQNSLTLERMLQALAMADDPFYRDQLPNYDWMLHKFRTYEYICSLTDLNNAKQFDEEQLKTIGRCTKEMMALYESEESGMKNKHLTKDIILYKIRNEYLAGETDLATYKAKLVEIMMQDFRIKKGEDVPIVMLQAPLEYMLLLDPEHLSAEEESYLNFFYNRLISYIHQTPKKDMLTFLLTCLSLIMKYFIRVSEGMDLETLGLNLIAALNPPTFVHSLSVAGFAKCLTSHLLQKNPELFVGMPGYDDIDAVNEHTAEIEDFVYHASLCHDFGKPAIAETIMTYGRKLLPEEFLFIKAHPSTGAYLLSKQSETAPYADIARGHHKWFNDEGGYPESFRLSESPYKTVVSIVRCADCLDAATDSIGRSYKKGKTLDEFLEELRAGSGTLYAPYIVDLMDDPEVRMEVEMLLKKGRNENYRKTYFTLKKYLPTA